MTAPAVTAGPDEPLGAAARRMHDRNVKRLPVVDHVGALIGIVTRADLLKVFLRPDRELRFEILDGVAGELLRLPTTSLDVEVADGVARLAGRLPRRSQALALQRLAQGVDGIVAVDSRLEWDTDDTLGRYLPSEPLPLL